MSTYEQAIRTLKGKADVPLQTGIDACNQLLQHYDSTSRVGQIAIPFLLRDPLALGRDGWGMVARVARVDSQGCITHTSLIMNKLATAIEGGAGDDALSFMKWIFGETYFCPTLDQVHTCLVHCYAVSSGRGKRDNNNINKKKKNDNNDSPLATVLVSKFDALIISNNNARKVFTSVASNAILLANLPEPVLAHALIFRHAPYESVLWETMNKNRKGLTPSLARLVTFFIRTDANLLPIIFEKVSVHTSESLAALFTSFAQHRRDRLHLREYLLTTVATKVLVEVTQQRDPVVVNALLAAEPDCIDVGPDMLPKLLHDCARRPHHRHARTSSPDPASCSLLPRDDDDDNDGGDLLDTLVHMQFRLRAIPDLVRAVHEMENHSDRNTLTELLGASRAFCEGLARHVPQAQIADVLSVFDTSTTPPGDNDNGNDNDKKKGTPTIYLPLFTLITQHLVCDNLPDSAAIVTTKIITAHASDLDLVSAARDVLVLTRDNADTVRTDWERHSIKALAKSYTSLVSLFYRAHYCHLSEICEKIARVALEHKKSDVSLILLALTYVPRPDLVDVLPRVVARRPQLLETAEFWELLQDTKATTALVKSLDVADVCKAPLEVWGLVDKKYVTRAVDAAVAERDNASLRYLVYARPDIAVPVVVRDVLLQGGDADARDDGGDDGGHETKKRKKKERKKRERERRSSVPVLDVDILSDTIMAACLCASDHELYTLVSSRAAQFDDVIFDHIALIDTSSRSKVREWNERLDRVLASLDSHINNDDDKALRVLQVVARAVDQKCVTATAIPTLVPRALERVQQRVRALSETHASQLACVAHILSAAASNNNDSATTDLSLCIAARLESDDAAAWRALFLHANVATFSSLVALVRDREHDQGRGAIMHHALLAAKSARVRRDILTRQAIHIVPRLAFGLDPDALPVATQLLLVASASDASKTAASRAFSLVLEQCVTLRPIARHLAPICQLLESVIKHRVSELVSPCIATYCATIVALVRTSLAEVVADVTPLMRVLTQAASSGKLVFPRYAPMILAELIAGFERHAFTSPRSRTTWMQGVNALFDVTSTQDLQLLHQSANVAGKDLLKSCYDHYQSHYKYTGKV